MQESLNTLLCGMACIGAVLLFVIAVGIFLWIQSSNRSKKMVIPASWHAVKGRITAAAVEETARTRPDDDVFFYPAIKYEYEVEGQIYTGRRAVGKPYNLEAIAKRALAKYPSGAEITLRYNPENPGESRLQEI